GSDADQRPPPRPQARYAALTHPGPPEAGRYHGGSSRNEFPPMPDALTTERNGPDARLRLERPDLHNAFDAALISALTTALEQLAGDASVRVVVLEGSGRSFSAGADLNWMRGMAAAGEAENHA